MPCALEGRRVSLLVVVWLCGCATSPVAGSAAVEVAVTAADAGDAPLTDSGGDTSGSQTASDLAAEAAADAIGAVAANDVAVADASAEADSKDGADSIDAVMSVDSSAALDSVEMDALPAPSKDADDQTDGEWDGQLADVPDASDAPAAETDAGLCEYKSQPLWVPPPAKQPCQVEADCIAPTGYAATCWPDGCHLSQKVVGQCINNVDCDDASPGTIDVCVIEPGEAAGYCISKCTQDCTSSQACDDGLACTFDYCIKGAGCGMCAHKVVGCCWDDQCGDGDPCTADWCEAAECKHAVCLPACSPAEDGGPADGADAAPDVLADGA